MIARLLTLVTACFLAGYVPAGASENPLPCEALSQAAAVFTGVAEPPVYRIVTWPDHPPIRMKLSVVIVDRIFRGVTTPVVYLTPMGVEHYLVAGQRYLV
jgi:hypothetical protein